MKENSQKIKVAQKGETVFIKICSSGTVDNSFQLKEFLRHLMAKGFKDFVLCLEDCPYMDSTFLGVIVGISLRLKENFGSKLKLTGINKYNLNLIKALEVIHLFDASPKKTSFTAKRKTLEKKKDVSILQKAQHIKKAHYNLMKVSPVCQMQFIDIQELLSKEIKELRHPPQNK